MSGCDCPTAGVTSRDEQQHRAWHELVHRQTGLDPTAAVNAHSLRAIRGFHTPTLPGPTLLDDRAIATGKRRSSTATYVEARARENARKAAADGRTRPRDDERELYR